MRRHPWQMIFALTAIGCMLLYCEIFAADIPSLPHPDEISAFDIFLRHGFFGGIAYYWVYLIGRPSAIGWLGAPAILSHIFGMNPWYAIVGARAGNFVMLAVCLSILLITVFRQLPIFLSLSIAAALLTAVLTSVGMTGVINFWLADQAIYLFSFMTYCLVLACFWRIVRRGLDKYSWWLVPLFALYLSAQEVNLVTGGVMLAIYFTFHFESLFLSGRLTNGDSRVNRVSPAAHQRFSHVALEFMRRQPFFLTLCAVYLSAACVQLASPSVDFRLKVWPPIMGWSDAIDIGVRAGLLPLLELRRLTGPALPLIASGIALGLWSHVGRPLDAWRTLLLQLPILIATSTSVLMAVLSTRYGLMAGSDNIADMGISSLISGLHLTVLASRQNIYAYLLWYTGFFFSGVSLGALFTRGARYFEIWRFFPLIALLSLIWLTTANLLSPTFARAIDDNWVGQLQMATQLLRPLAEPPGFDRKRYIGELLPDEDPLHIWAGAAPIYGGYPIEATLAEMFPGPPIVFVPCAVASALAECHVPELPRFGRRLDSSETGLGSVWRNNVGGIASHRDDRLVFSEDASDGEHYLTTGDLARGERTLVEITAIIRANDVAVGRVMLLEVVSADGSACVTFDLTQAKISGYAESGARALDGSIRRLSAGTAIGSRFEMKTRFVVFGNGHNFEVRIENSPNDRTTYQGDGHTQWQVETSSIQLLDTGKSALRLQAKPGANLRLYGDDP